MQKRHVSKLLALKVAALLIAIGDTAYAYTRGCTAYPALKGIAEVKYGDQPFTVRIPARVYEIRRKNVFSADRARLEACRGAANNAAHDWVRREDAVRALACDYARTRYREFLGRIRLLTVVGIAERKKVIRYPKRDGGGSRNLYVEKRWFECDRNRRKPLGEPRRLGRVEFIEVSIRVGDDDLRRHSRGYLFIHGTRKRLNDGRDLSNGRTYRYRFAVGGRKDFKDIDHIGFLLFMDQGDLGSGLGFNSGDDWSIERICVRAWNRNTTVIYMDEKSFPLVRFKSSGYYQYRDQYVQNSDRKIRNRHELYIPLAWPRKVKAGTEC